MSVKLARDNEFKKPDGTPALLAITRGLAAFGIMEIEVRGYTGRTQDLYVMLIDLSDYLIKSGNLIKDGDTIGRDARTKFTVRWQASTLLPERKVHRVYVQ